MNIVQDLITGNRSSQEIIEHAKINLHNLSEDDIFILVYLNMLNHDDLRDIKQCLSEDVILRLISNLNKILKNEKEDVKGLDFIKKEPVKKNNEKEFFYFLNNSNNADNIFFDYVNSLDKEVLTDNVMLLCIKLLKGGLTKNILDMEASSNVLFSLIKNEQNSIALKLKVTRDSVKETCKKLLISKDFYSNELIDIISIGKKNGFINNEMLEIFENMQSQLLLKIKGENSEEERIIKRIMAEYLITEIFSKNIDNKYKDKILEVLKVKELFLFEEGILYENFKNEYYYNQIIIENENDYQYFEKLLDLNVMFYKFLKEDKTKKVYNYLGRKLDSELDSESEAKKELFFSLFREHIMKMFFSYENENKLDVQEDYVLLLTKDRMSRLLNLKNLEGCVSFNVNFLNFLNNENAQKMKFKGVEDFYSFFVDKCILSDGEEHFKKWTQLENVKKIISNQMIPSIMKNNTSISEEFKSKVFPFKIEVEFSELQDYKQNRKKGSNILSGLSFNVDNISKESEKENIFLAVDEFGLFNNYTLKLSKEDSWLNEINEKIKKIKTANVIIKDDVMKFLTDPVIVNSYMKEPEGVDVIIIMALKIKSVEEELFLNTIKFLREKNIKDDYLLKILMKENKEERNVLMLNVQTLNDLDYLKKIFSLDFLYSKQSREIIIKKLSSDNVQVSKQDLLIDLIIRSKNDENLIIPMCNLYNQNKEDLLNSTLLEHVINGKLINKIMLENIEDKVWVKKNEQVIYLIALKKDLSEMLSKDFKKKLLNSDIFNNNDYVSRETAKNFLLNSNDDKFIDEYIEHVKTTGRRTLSSVQMYEIFKFNDILNTEKVIEFMNIITGTRKESVSLIPEWLVLNKELRMVLKELTGTSCIELINNFSLTSKEWEDQIIIKYEEIEMQKEIKHSVGKKIRRKF